MKTTFCAAMAFAIALTTGCAAQLQSTDDLQAATAMQLGLQTADVTISNRQDSGFATNYWVQTRTGTRYSCVRTAGPSLFGVNKSSPLCSLVGQAANGRSQPAPQNELERQYQQRRK